MAISQQVNGLTRSESAEPIVRGALVRAGTHVDLVGAFTPAMRESDDELVADHLIAAGVLDRGVTYLIRAADAAAKALAFDRAARSYRFALDLGRFDDGGRAVRIKLGATLAASGRGYDAAQAYLAAFKAAGWRQRLPLTDHVHYDGWGNLGADGTLTGRLRQDQAAIDSGYRSSSAFIAAFRSSLHMTPARYFQRLP